MRRAEGQKWHERGACSGIFRRSQALAELTTKERLQPSLLDRLTDDEPENTQESREKRVLSPSRIRDSVKRDLSWLFNAVHLSTVEELEDYPQVQRSVLNYGFPDLAGRTVSTVDTATMERVMRRVIWDFEPRLIRNSVKVKLVADPDKMGHNAMSFTIEADLWSQPLPMRLYLKTELDLEDGTVKISEVGGTTEQG
jgi:type VI secretion system protein ImpF